MKLEKETLKLLRGALERLEQGFADLPDYDQPAVTEAWDKVLAETAEALQDNYPYFHPLYAGQMLKPPHPVARAAYMLAMWINPNNHALDGGRASSHMEKEAVANLAALFGWKEHLGHLTGGGTMANMEALWVAGRKHPGKKILASEQAHYTHGRISGVLQLPFEAVPCNTLGQMDLTALEAMLKSGEVGTVVATAGTTGTGAVDPVADLVELRKSYPFRLHIDAAYGGYFVLADNLKESTRRHFDALSQADSIVIDPHKHGLQPYGCGCVIFKDSSAGVFYKHDSPYTYFSSSELHLGEISLECSRAGASAVALWTTMKLLPLTKGGQFARDLGKCRGAAEKLYAKIAGDARFKTFIEPELDIVVWAPNGKTAGDISRRSADIFHKAAEKNLHLATFNYPSSLLRPLWPEVDFDRDTVTCLRSVLMKPEHLEWVEEIWGRVVGMI